MWSSVVWCGVDVAFLPCVVDVCCVCAFMPCACFCFISRSISMAVVSSVCCCGVTGVSCTTQVLYDLTLTRSDGVVYTRVGLIVDS